MKKKIIFCISLVLGIGLLLFFVFSTKGMQFEAMAKAGAEKQMPPTSVSTHLAESQTWPVFLQAVGTVEPVRGVILEAEVPGIVDAIEFENGQNVQAGDLLIQFDVDVEKAQLRAAQAARQLAELEYQRAKRLRESGNVPQSDLDRAVADMDRTQAELENIEAVIDRKTIRAPFSGRVGIREINLGQYVPIGAALVSLQSNNQVYVNFTLPQQSLSELSEGLTVHLRSDAFPERKFTGKLTAISPQVDAVTRTIKLQSTFDNPDGTLRAGLFVKVNVELPESESVIAIPQTAVVYAPYGNSIYIIEEADENLIAKQKFIRTGRSLGDFVNIIDGLEAGDEVVTAGTFKLFNGAPVSIQNDMAPEPELDPKPDNI